MHPYARTMILLACFCSASGSTSMSAYNKKLELLSSVVKHDNLWRKILLEKVYFELDRTYYKNIIEDELLVGARVTGEADVAGTSDPSNKDTRDRIIPYVFIKNILSKQRFVVGSILDMGLEVLKVSYKCLLYKHMVHLITLISVEMSRKKSQKKAGSWSGKNKQFVESIVMTMGALQFTDEHVLKTLSFFDIYKAKSNGIADDVKNMYIKQLDERSKAMMNYVTKNCVVKPTENSKKLSMERQVAIMLGVYINDNLYKTAASFSIENPDFKKMVQSSQKGIQDTFGNTPGINGMSKSIWHDILHYQENLELNRQYD